MHVRVGKSKCKWIKSKSEIVKNDVYSKVYVIFLVSINIFFILKNSFFCIMLEGDEIYCRVFDKILFSIVKIYYVDKIFAERNLNNWYGFLPEDLMKGENASNSGFTCILKKAQQFQLWTLVVVHEVMTGRKWFVRSYVPRKHGPIKKLFTCSSSTWRIIC